MDDYVKSEVFEYIGNNIENWIEQEFVPCLKTFVDTQSNVFVDVSAKDFNTILSIYCKEKGIGFGPNKQKKINRKNLTCFHFFHKP